MARVIVGDDHHAVAEGESGTVPVDPPKLGKAEGVTQPLDCLLDIGVDQFRDDTADPVVRLISTRPPFVD